MSSIVVNEWGDELPKEIQELAWKRYDRKFDARAFAKTQSVRDMFDWSKTIERANFWDKICHGDYAGFYRSNPKTVDNYSII